MLGYVIKAPLHAHEGAQRDNVSIIWETKIIPCPAYPQAHPRSHQPVKGPSPQAQRITGARNYRWEPKLQTPEEWTPCPSPSRADSGDLQPGVKPTKMSHHPQPSWSAFGLKAWRGREFQDCTRLTIGYLGGELKVEKERDLGDFGRKKYGKIVV